MQKFKIDDKVKFIIPEKEQDYFNSNECKFDGDWQGINYYPESMKIFIGATGNIIDYTKTLNSYTVSFNGESWCIPENWLEDAIRNALNGHIWLITNKQTGKVIEGYQTSKEARENFCNYDNPSDFKIVKYSFN